MQTYPSIYNSATSTFLSILRTQGITNGLFKGSLVPILSVVPANALAFSGEDLFRTILQKFFYKSDESLGGIASYCGGTFGGLIQCLVLIPPEVQTIMHHMTTLEMSMSFEEEMARENVALQ